MRVRIQACVGVAGLALLGGGLLLLRGATDQSDDVSIPPRTPVSATAALDIRLSVLPPAGSAIRYSTEIQSEVRAEDEVILGFVLRGDWELTAVPTCGSSTIHGRFQSPSFKSSAANGTTEALIPSIERGFEQSHFFSLGDTGAVTEVRLSPEIPSITEGVLKSLIAAFQFSHDATRTEWVAEETDTTGIYEASYRRVDKWNYAREKTRYLEILGGSSPLLNLETSTEIVASSATFTFDGPLRTFASTEETTVVSRGPLPNMRSKTQITLKRMGIENVPEPLAVLTRACENTTPHALHETVQQGGVRLDTDLARISGLTLDGALTTIADLPEGQGSGQRARLYSGVAALLRQSTAQVDEAVRRIGARDPQSDLLLDALGDAGSPASQKALGELFSDARLDAEAKRRALISLSFVPHATHETTRLLEGSLDDPVYGAQARYGLGSAVHRLIKESPGHAAEALTALLAHLDAQDSNDQLMDDLIALGNAGHPASLSTIERYLVHSDAAVRAAAVTALRRIPGDAVDKHLADALAQDSSVLIRRSAVRAIDERKRSTVLVSAVDGAIRNEPDVTVRSAAIHIAAKWGSHERVLQGALAWAAENDRNEKLRRVAQTNLQDLLQRG